MQIDQDRLREILQRKHSYYGSGDIPIRKDYRWFPARDDFIAAQITSAARVLDLGCGSGGFLLEQSACFHSGLGIDIDPEHLQLAEQAKQAQGIQNVEFRLLDFPRDAAQLPPESFDLVTSFRGPLGDNAEEFQAAYRLLRPAGLIFCEEIAEEHQKEIDAIFWPPEPGQGTDGEAAVVRKVDQVRTMLERSGFDVRLALDHFSKWIYPDVYAWFAYICNLWTWLNIPLLEPDDPRIAQFAEQNTNASGEIVTTHHVAWVAGIKI
jgi:SAM-dependent methyltransferase